MNPVFELYERSLIAEAVEKHYGPALYNEERLNERYLKLQIESFEQMSICNTAAESLYQWLNNNSSMSMEQAVLVSKQINLIEKIYPGLRIINPSEEIIQNIKAQLTDNGLLSEDPIFDNTFYASDLSENFVNMINRIFENSDFKVAFKSFDLDTCK